MQSLDHLVDSVAVNISERKNLPGDYFFSKIDLKFGYSQIPLDKKVQKLSNFKILGGRATGTYRFINGFYGMTDMTATFQKTIDKTLQHITTKFAFLDDILVVTKCNLQDHENELDKNNEKIKQRKFGYDFAKEETVWLGFKVTPNGVAPKCEVTLKLEAPKSLKQLRSFMGYIHHLIKFLHNLAQHSEPLRPLLSKANIKP